MYDEYRGVVCFTRLSNGRLRKGQKILLMGRERQYVVSELGKMRPGRVVVDSLSAGEAGYFVASIKTLADVTVGDTVTDSLNPAAEPMPGYDPPKQVVFCDFYPAGGEEYDELRDALSRLSLNDASFTYQPQSSDAARVRVSVRLPGSVAHGHCAGAPGTRVRRGCRADRAERHLRGAADQR